MKPPLYIRHVTDEERAALEAGLRRHEAFTVRRCQIVLASAEGRKPAQIATTLHCAPQTVRNVIHAFNARGLACVQHGSTVPLRIEPVLKAEKREQ
jgi:DNA-binding CsgD family transcriptional regulator